MSRGRSRCCRSTGPGGRTKRGEGVHQRERIEVCGEIGIRVVLIRHICGVVRRRLRGTVRRDEERDLQARESRRRCRRSGDSATRSSRRAVRPFGGASASALGIKLASYLLGDERSFRIADDEQELIRILLDRLVQHRDTCSDAVVDVKSRRVVNRNVGESVRERRAGSVCSGCWPRLGRPVRRCRWWRPRVAAARLSTVLLVAWPKTRTVDRAAAVVPSEYQGGLTVAAFGSSALLRKLGPFSGWRCFATACSSRSPRCPTRVGRYRMAASLAGKSVRKFRSAPLSWSSPRHLAQSAWRLRPVDQ